ncbi:SAM-dependent DNA methyltransferase [Candidatus Daviesbacteria bacterium]|nr:SAM-dependent DNA methyltransferase [Candidatus Daviesbacteria bacterium]MBI2596727.1 SAM-dependent DNA methyltransferase [Candidatus Daviesbacteria bacterium]
MTIKNIKSKWAKEKDYYRNQEVGSGVQSFIRACLESEELFSLTAGSLSTNLESRKKEYIHEDKAKERRKADFVIYIDSDIVVPLEVECFGKIKAGVQQLFSYQKDYNKEYGILTDGFTWRFYNNNIYREFNLNQILEETDLFLEFWKEYIKPEFYYLSFFEPQGQLSFLKEIERLPVDAHRQIFFEDITKLIKSFKNKLQVEGYFTNLEKKEKEKKAIEITYAYIIQFILYKTLVDNGFGNFYEDFNNSVKKIHEYLKGNRYKDILGIIDGISTQISENIYRPFAEEQKFINQTLLQLYHKVENKLSDISPWLDIFVFIKKFNFSNIQNEIFGYIYENYLKELYEEAKKGQYFTDPAVVNFMLREIGYEPEKIQQRLKHDPDGDYISLIDPSCGSGTFLYRATDQVINAVPNGSEDSSKRIEELVNNNIFGLDIEEFPLYLAEMNILMRMLPLIINEKYNNPVDKKIKMFKTKDSIAEFMDTAIRNTLNDMNIEFQKVQWHPGQVPLFTEKLDFGYSSYVRNEDDLGEMKKSLENQAQIRRYRFDYVIGNPPYVSYNECARQKVLIFELMKQGKAKLNNIYGVNLHSIPDSTKKYRPNPNLYAFFVALGIALLKDNGKLCYIIPQTILTAGDLDVLRYHLAKFTTIEKIITFSGKMFIGRGLTQNKPVATSSLIILISRKLPTSLHEVEIINYLDPKDDIEKTLNNILVNKKVSKNKILQLRLLQNVANWNFIKQNKKSIEFYEAYKKASEGISIYYEHSLALHYLKSKFFFDSGYDIDERKLLKERPDEEYYYYPKLNSNFWTVKDYRGFWPNMRSGNSPHIIKLRQANQGYNLLDSKFKIIWSYANPHKFHFTSKQVIWARNQICAIGSENKNEILYLFSLLNSPIIRFVLDSNLRNENEKDFLVSTTAVKEFVRVPKINGDNQAIKNEIIKRTEKMLTLEDKRLSDFVDFSRVMIQKTDNVAVRDDLLILGRDLKELRLPIKRSSKLINRIIQEQFNKNELQLNEEKISVTELKNLLIIDKEKQDTLKNQIDQLVYKLYGLTPAS